MSTVIEQFGGEGFADFNDFLNRTSFRSGPNPSTLVTRNVFGTTNEKWLTGTRGSSSYLGFIRNLFPSVQANNAREVEISFAMNIGENINDTVVGVALQNTVSDNLDNDPMWALQSRPSNITGLENEIHLVTEPQSGTDRFIPTGALLTDGAVFYITLRHRAETAVSANDGAIELYINGSLVASAYSENWGSVESTATHTGANLKIIFGGFSSAETTFYRNITIRDGWSTADGVAPEFLHIQDMVPTSVSGADYTNEGGAVDATTAVSDNDDTTFLASSVAAAELTLNYTADSSLVSYDVANVFTRIRAARGSAALNTITIDVVENTGGTSVGTFDVDLAAVGPSRDQVSQVIEPSATVTADDFSIRITNGS